MTRTSCSSRIITLLLMIISFLHGGFTLNSDGLTLLSLLTHWTFVPPLINSSWKASDSDPCSWFGVQCDRKQNLISLNLTSHEIFGQLGPEIGNLYHLENLLLFGNSFSGKVPSELSNCSLLEKLDLSENRFNGKIPHSLKRLRNLKSMRLSSNLLTGEIPDSLFEIPSLEEVSLHSNLLSGNIPTNIGNLTHLLRLYLYGNMFSGTIPSSLGNCSKLEDLELSSNRLRGKIPVSIWRISSLVHILVHNNNLSGELPFEMTNLRYLKNISLFFNENNFTGSLPDFESNMNLKYMDMSKNSIGGPIPSSLGNYTNLTYINLSSNKFAGLIPLELGNLANLVILDLSHNNLEGPLPLQLSKCTNMDRFDVGFNFLNGSFPSSLISWRGISTLVLRENHFTGGIPGFLAEFSNLRELQLGGNSFGGKIPRSMGTLHNLFYGLNLSDNGLTGGIPSEIGMLGLLQSLDISLNNLTGNIDALEGLVSLIEVNISYNLFNGSVPTRLIRLLNSSPSSFMGNPLLCFRCLNCFKTSFINPCIYKPTDHKGIGNVQIVMIELGPSIFVSGVVVIIILTYLRRNELKKGSDPKQQSHTERKLPDLHDRVLEATENLNDQYIIGRGAHGIVYKAIVYRRVCAIKKVQYGWNKQKWLSIMRSEIEVLRMIRHRNLIKYRNHWIGNDYGLVIYDFIDNGSLYNILHEKKPPPPLTWNVRFNLAVGIAQGLAYLHYDCVPPIVHRDIKPKNILVDDNLEPIIADFGTALHRKLFEDSYSHSETRKMLSSRVVGTPGYIAPENAYDIVPGRKSDVYSYGVVLLELITRKKLLVPSMNDEVKETHIVTWARSVLLETGKIEKIADPYLASAFPNSEVLAEQVNAVLSLALQCTEKDPRRRPTMKDVIGFYNTNLFKLRCDKVQYCDGLVIKLMGNGKILSEKFASIANLAVPKINYVWPSLIFLPSITGPILIKPFNWFFLSRWGQYRYLQKSLYSKIKSPYSISTNQTEVTVQLSEK